MYICSTVRDHLVDMIYNASLVLHVVFKTRKNLVKVWEMDVAGTKISFDVCYLFHVFLSVIYIHSLSFVYDSANLVYRIKFYSLIHVLF